ncbi:MAG: NADH-quinone oxidoreductase subunit J [Candidatus Aminicenantia bacterium]
MVYLIFILLALTAIGAVIGMILSKNQAYNALFLALSFAAIGGLYGLLDAPFIAVVQIIIYAGAIIVLFMFVIMIINLRKGIAPEKKKWTTYLALILGLAIFIQIIFTFSSTFSIIGQTGLEKKGSPFNLGVILFSDYLYPFEITSLLILAALVGAIVLLKRKQAK